ncbi:MAG TPA: type II TA system antitoxin MqsA family protein [Syntrophobacteraceae bacterium]|nr:type II TA system antitoxin MqsA family protein [Syntrophobacteraceae bacterium]
MEFTTKCPFCGNLNVQTKSRQSYHFKESGLDNVYLKNVETYHCPDCHANMVSIPHSAQLLSCLGEAIVFSPGLLTGPEIRFLRKNLRIKINDFAKLLRVSRVTVSRWENGQDITKPIDLLIRTIYLLKGPGINEKTRDAFRNWLEKQLVEKQRAKRRRRIEIPFPLDQFSCIPASAYAQKTSLTV